MKVFILAVFVYFSYHNFHMSKQFADEIQFLHHIPNWHRIVGTHYLVKKVRIIHFSKCVWPNVLCYFWIAQQDWNGDDAAYVETMLSSELNMRLYVQISFNLKSPFEIWYRQLKIPIRYI